MKNKTQGISRNMALGIVAIIFVLGVLIWKKDAISEALGIKSNASTNNNQTGNTSTSSQGNAVNLTIDRNKILKYGDTGASVKELQRLLNQHHKSNRNQVELVPYESLVEDGIFGKKTEGLLEHYTQTKSISINQLASKLAIKLA
jgi:peptidoglycan hydrolase-like protein with peptidoglycan-binding domain